VRAARVAGGRRLALAVAFLSGLVALSACKAPTSIDAPWPTAVSERAIAQPAGTPRWPLTGLDAPTASAVLARVVSVKIENSPQARPQSGLDKADVVYESVTEGGITRFNALYQSQTSKVIGPVRSARPSDFAIVQQYDALFAHCGGDPQVRKELTDKSRYQDMDQFFNPQPYWRVTTRPAPHNLFVDISKVRVDAVTKRGYPATAQVRGLTFTHESTVATPQVRTLTVAFSSSNKVVWKYNTAAQGYLRSVGGVAQVDAVSHQQYAARNVVVLWANIRRYSVSHNSQLMQIELTGNGRTTVFRDGQHFDGTWEASTDAPPVLRGSDGRIIALDPGNTWFEVIANDQGIMMQ
jgi:hypothetical protein